MDHTFVPKCSECNKEYGLVQNIPKVLACRHRMCSNCVAELISYMRYSNGAGKDECRVEVLYKCNQCYEYFQVEDNEELIKCLEAQQRFLEICQKNERKTPEKKSGMINCSECDESDKEANTQTCISCVSEKSGSLEHFVKAVEDKKAELGDIAICAACAIRNHFKKGHDVVDYFPIMSPFRYSEYIEKFRPSREIIVADTYLMESTMIEVLNTIKNSEYELDFMERLLKYKKTSEEQKSFANKIGQQVKKNYILVDKLNKSIGSIQKEMENMLNELHLENLKEEGADISVKKEEEEGTDVSVKEEAADTSEIENETRATSPINVE